MTKLPCLSLFLCLLTMTHEIRSLSAKPGLALKAEWIQLTPRGYAEVDEPDQGMRRFVVNDLWEWDDHEGWTEQEQQSDTTPGPRLASAAVVLNGSPYLIGGWDPQTAGTGGIILDMVQKLDVSTGKWQELSSPLPDGPTSRHAALALPGAKKALIHNHRCTDHVLVLDSDTDTIRVQPTTGTAPSSRGLHAAAMAGKTAVIFGGAAKDTVMSNEVFLLNTDTWEWTPIQLESDDCPSPRAGACMCRYSDECVLLFGGAETTETGLNPKGDIWALSFDDQEGKGLWTKLLDETADGLCPPPRNAATLSRIDAISGREGEGSCFLLSGGWAPFRTTWNDSFVLNVSPAK